ncbi:hypothetical protein D3C87_1899190 [compost metagenome]
MQGQQGEQGEALLARKVDYLALEHHGGLPEPLKANERHARHPRLAPGRLTHCKRNVEER